MQSLLLEKRVNTDGSLMLTDLPPDQDVVILINPKRKSERSQPIWAELQAELIDHPFRSMSREEVLESLRRTRDEIARERYGD